MAPKNLTPDNGKTKPKLRSMMEYNGPKRTGKSPLEEGLDFIFSPFSALSDIVNQNAPIKKGGKYQVPQSMMEGRTKRKNPVTAHPKARTGKAAGYAIGNMAKNAKRINGMKVR